MYITKIWRSPLRLLCEWIMRMEILQEESGHETMNRVCSCKVRLAGSSLAALAILMELSAIICTSLAAAQTASSRKLAAHIESFFGTVEISRTAGFCDPAHTNQVLAAGHHLRTGKNSGATIRLSDTTLVRVGELSHFELFVEDGQTGLNVFEAVLYLLHRDKPARYKLRTPTVTAGVHGTEFNFQVAADGTSTIAMFDGTVEMSNPLGQMLLNAGETGVAAPNQPPIRTAMLPAANIIEWCLYYPGVLDLAELKFTESERSELAGSTEAYRSGDLVAALLKYPENRATSSNAEKLYHAAVLLSVGHVRKTEALLASIEATGSAAQYDSQLVAALRMVIAAVKLEPTAPLRDASQAPQLATEWLAQSYLDQAHSRLPEALVAARRVVAISPEFSFGWSRLAELEFSFGHVSEARSAIETSLHLAPRNPQAWTIKGFIAAADNKPADAEAAFDHALSINSSLGNAWLGRGLSRIRRGRTESGLQDLQMAAAAEPQRAVLRSYLGKAFAQHSDLARAGHELALAKRFDPNDPTAWLYSALVDRDLNQLNDAVRDLEQSQRLNNNRKIYRSSLLLEQDRAMRGANLASIYRDNGMNDVALREAARAVNSD